MDYKYTSYIQLSIAMFLAGSSVIAGKLLVTIPIFFSQMLSSLIAFLIIYPIAKKVEGKFKISSFKKRDLVLLFFQALTGNFLFRIFLILGLKYTNSIESGIILGTSPVVLVILSFVFLKEKISKRLIIAVLLCTIGIILLKTSNFNSSFVSLSFAGYILIFLAVVSESLFTIFRKKQSSKNKHMTATTIIMLFSFILFLPMGFYQMFNLESSFTIVHISSILYYSIVCSVIAYIFWFLGISKIPASSAAVFTGIMPISSVILSIVILNENLYWQHILGLIFTIGSVYIVNKWQRNNC